MSDGETMVCEENLHGHFSVVHVCGVDICKRLNTIFTRLQRRQ